MSPQPQETRRSPWSATASALCSSTAPRCTSGSAKRTSPIYGTSTDPIETYQQFAHNLGQTVLRSESESHFLPADWPTFAPARRVVALEPRAAVSLDLAQVQPGRLGDPRRGPRRQPSPRLGRGAGAGARRLAPARGRWRLRPAALRALRRSGATSIGRAKHVMLALGHGPLSFPPVLSAAKARDPVIGERIVQAYEPKQYDPRGRYIVIGAASHRSTSGPTHSTRAPRCIALRRHAAPDEQDLNVPRCLFEARGHRHLPGALVRQPHRVSRQGAAGHRTAPARAGRERIAAGRAEGRFEELIGEIDAVERGPRGLRVHVSSGHGEDAGWLDVTGVVAGTGFVKSALAHPAAAAADRALRHPLRGRSHQAPDQLRHPGAGPPRSPACA